MEIKKNENADLEKKKGIFLQIGFVLTLIFVFWLFEYTTSPTAVEDLAPEDIPEEFQKADVTNQPPPEKLPPPPPPQIADNLNVDKDNKDIEDEVDFDFGDADDDTEITVVKKEEEEEQQIFAIVEQMPEFPGGMKALLRFIGNNTKYPALAREQNIQGKVYVRFVVTNLGKVEQVSVARSVDPLLDKEAIRVVKKLPTWKPGRQRGKAVSVWYTVPINYTLQQ